MLQEAERYYVKVCHELRHLAAPLPFEVSRRIAGKDIQNNCTTNARPSAQTSSTNSSPPTSPTHINTYLKQLAIKKSDERIIDEDASTLEAIQPSDDGHVPLKLPEIIKLPANTCATDVNALEKVANHLTAPTTDSEILFRVNITSLEHDVRKYISNVRNEQSRAMLHCTSQFDLPINGSAPSTPTEPSDHRSRQRLDIKERIKSGTRRYEKQRRFSGRRYEELCTDVLRELDEKENRLSRMRKCHISARQCKIE